MNKSMYKINPIDYKMEEDHKRPNFVFNKNEYELKGGSAKTPEDLEFNINDIVLIEDDIIITRHMASYYWWWNKDSANNYADAYWRAYSIIQEMKLVDEGYPLYELKKELALIRECQCLDDVKCLKRQHSANIKWHDVRWQKREYSDCGDDRVTWALIPKGSDGSPKREPEYKYRSGYWEWGNHYTIEETIE